MMQTAYAGIGWLYSNSLGAIFGGVENFTLSSAENFVFEILAGFLAIFAAILNDIASAVSSFFQWEASIALSMGIWGPPIAIISMVALAAIILTLIRTVIDLL